MSGFALGNAFLLACVVSTSIGHLVIKQLVDDVQIDGALEWASITGMLSGERLLRAGLAGTLIGAGFLFWLLAIARLELSYAYPIAASSVLLVAFLSAIFLHEPVTLRIWMGSALVLLGIACLTPR